MARTRQILVKFMSSKDEDHIDKQVETKRFHTEEKPVETSSRKKPKLQL